MSKRKISSYFESERNKNNNAEEEKPENEFHNEDDDAEILNSKLRIFQTKWLKWLWYENNAMFCHFCRLARKKNPFGSNKGCTNFKTTS